MLDPAALAFLLPGLLVLAAGTRLALRDVASDASASSREVLGSPSGGSRAIDVLGFDLIVAGAVISTTALANAFAGLGVAFNVSVLLSSLLVAMAHRYVTSRPRRIRRPKLATREPAMPTPSRLWAEQDSNL